MYRRFRHPRILYTRARESCHCNLFYCVLRSAKRTPTYRCSTTMKRLLLLLLSSSTLGSLCVFNNTSISKRDYNAQVGRFSKAFLHTIIILRLAVNDTCRCTGIKSFPNRPCRPPAERARVYSTYNLYSVPYKSKFTARTRREGFGPLPCCLRTWLYCGKKHIYDMRGARGIQRISFKYTK